MSQTKARDLHPEALHDGVHYRGCTLCEAMCGLEIHVDEDNAVTSIRGDKQDPLSRGHICPKAVALQDIYEDSDRLRRPVKRLPNGEFEEIPWDEAFALAADGLRGLIGDRMALYAGNPNVHNYGSLLYGPGLFKILRTPHRYSATSVDQLPHHLIGYLCLGHMLLLPIPDLDRTDHLLVFGANPLVSNGSLMSAPDVKKRLKAIAERGKVTVVDPRRTETADHANEHVFIRPGTDVYLLLGILHTLFDEGLTALGRLELFTDGLDDVARLAEDWAPEKSARITGVDARTARRLARELASAKTAACYGRMGVSVQEFGSLCQWTILMINLVTGNLDRPGGVMFPTPAADILAEKPRGGSFGRWRSRVRGLPEFGGELPVASLSEDIEAKNGIRGLLTVAGNPVLSTPDGQRLERNLAGLDFMVSIDLYINETTRHADVILPPTSPLEHDHYDLAFHTLAIRDTARYTPPLFAKPKDARHDWEIFLELQKRLQPKPKMAARFSRMATSRLQPSGLLDLLLRRGPHGKGFLPGRDGLTLKKLRAEPHGVDLGPLKPSLPERLFTEDKRIHAAPEPVVGDFDRLEERFKTLVDEGVGSGLVLISRRQVRSNNSWMHNYRRLMRGKDRCTLMIHPDDAAARGIADGSGVTVRSRVGEVDVPAEVTDELMPGVVSLPHGWGHDRRGVRLSVASERPGASVNDLTDTELLDELSGNAALSGVPVTVELAPGGAPPGDAPSRAAGG
ncbi:MAG: molybdopterin oxidoreductase family protein [Acidobacteriota bacterium]